MPLGSPLATTILRAALVAAIIVPLGASAQVPTPPGGAFIVQTSTGISLLFRPPANWTSAQGRVPTFSRRDGDAIHMIVVGPVTDADIDSAALKRITQAKQRGATVVDEGITTICDGQPARQWTATSVNTGTPLQLHQLATHVRGGVAVATYGHPESVKPRADALAALQTLCAGPIITPVPFGWTAPKTSYPGAAVTSPDESSTFLGTAAPIASDKVATYEREHTMQGTVLTDRTEPCGDTSVRRLDIRNGDQIAETAMAYLDGILYRYVYTRPASRDVDASAERDLTAFCRAPSPSASPSPPPA